MAVDRYVTIRAEFTPKVDALTATLNKLRPEEPVDIGDVFHMLLADALQPRRVAALVKRWVSERDRPK